MTRVKRSKDFGQFFKSESATLDPVSAENFEIFERSFSLSSLGTGCRSTKFSVLLTVTILVVAVVAEFKTFPADEIVSSFVSAIAASDAILLFLIVLSCIFVFNTV